MAFFANGMQGDLVARLQRKLAQIAVPREDGQEGSEPAFQGTIDSSFGAATERAVRRVQRQRKEVPTGLVDRKLWEAITGENWDTGSFERHISLLASFEDHGYTKATAESAKEKNVGFTWGIIGFTFFTRGAKGKPTFGSMQPVLRDAIAAAPDAAKLAFGPARLSDLENVLALPSVPAQQAAMSDWYKGSSLAPEWTAAFAAFGENRVVQSVQLEAARKEYYELALQTAADFHLDSDRARQFFFDVVVNSGPLTPKERADSEKAIADLGPTATERDKLRKITGVLQKLNPAAADDIGARKGTIADGFGIVHARGYRLDGWGIEIPPSSPQQVAALSLERTTAAEQQRLADGVAARALVGPQHSEERWKALEQIGKSDGSRAFERLGGSTVQMAGLAGPAGLALRINPPRFHYALDLLLSEPVGVLVLSGDHGLQPKAGYRSLFLCRAGSGRMKAGFGLNDRDELHLFCGSAVDLVADEKGRFDVTRWREPLSHCQLLVILASNGVPYVRLDSWFRDMGIVWRNWLGTRGHHALVLGWYGNVRLPAGESKLMEEFVRNLPMGVNLRDLCQVHTEEVIQRWGEACHRAFAKTRPELWREQILPRLEESHSGCGAIAPDGTIWQSNANYGSVAEAAMIRVGSLA